MFSLHCLLLSATDVSLIEQRSSKNLVAALSNGPAAGMATISDAWPQV